MALLIISIILTLVAIGALGIQFGRDSIGDPYPTGWKINKKQILGLLPMLLCVFGLFTTIPANSVGIVYSPFGGTKNETLTEGFQAKSIFDKVYEISTEVQTMKIENLTTQTQDAQYLTSALDIKYRVNASNAFMVFKQFRTLDKMSESLIVPTTQKQMELVTTKYNVIDILGESRAAVYGELEAMLTEELALYGVEFVSITINDMDAGDAIEKAIEAEAVAKKEVETAAQNLLKAEKEAQQKSIIALADQEAAKIKAETLKIEAQAQKEANDLLKMSLSDLILKQQWIEKWDGHMPTYYGGAADLMIGLDEESK